MIAKQRPITYAKGLPAVWLEEDRWQVGLVDRGVTCERIGTRWFVCADGSQLMGPYTTLRDALVDAVPLVAGDVSDRT